MPTKLSRLNFIRLGSILGTGTLLKSMPAVSQIAEALGLSENELPKFSFTCDFFRSTDLLHFKYFFYNAKLSLGRIKKAGTGPMFLYVQLPVQHIAEPLINDPYNYNQQDFKRLDSFAAGRSVLAFKINSNEHDRNPTVSFSVDELLDWANNFSLSTIDDFANTSPDETYRDNYKPAIDRIKEKLAPQNGDHTTWLKNGKKGQWPLSSFQVPYKMFLSPIAEPDVFSNGEYRRKFGEHIFIRSNDVNIQFTSKDFTIVKPWENNLIFRTKSGEDLLPRFKVVKFLCPDNHDTGKELLPSPLNRYELNGLTMKPEFDRDVWSELFSVSALGANADLFYKNDDPTIDYAIVAWEHIMRFGRDNHVSVTYRAVDFFTGLKLKISIIGERDYKKDVSFIPKLYHVAFAEECKVFDTPIVISRIHCKKITPLTKGKFFYPKPIPNLGQDIQNSAFAVDVPTAVSGGEFICTRLLDFEYLCVDKNGKEVKIKTKLIFIPAESYVIKSGAYSYCNDNGEVEITYGHNVNSSVSIAHIGQLNPANLVNFGTASPCSTPPTPGYTFQMVKNFNSDQGTILTRLLNKLREHVGQNITCYESKVDEKQTYARINNLINSSNNVRKDAANATFHTKAILLGYSEIDKSIYPMPFPTGQTPVDNYQNRFPIVPGLEHADVIISQIDQIEGRSVYRRVSYFNPYFKGTKEIDEFNEKNVAKLLFKIEKPLGDFFSENYRSSGAVVNPGIEISHVSVFDQGISYNERVNDAAALYADPKISPFDENVTRDVSKLIDGPTFIPSATIFKPLKAEILGVPILAIIDDVLPAASIPVFSFAQQTQDTIEKINTAIAEYQSLFQEWKNKYNTLKQFIETAPQQIDALEKIIKGEIKKQLQEWFDTFLAQSGALEYYTSLKKNYDIYKNYNVVVFNKIKAKVSNETKKAIADFLKNPEINEFKALLVELKPPLELSHYKEIIKIFVAEQLIEYKKYNESYKKVVDLSKDIEEKYKRQYNAVLEGVTEAAVFVENAIDTQAKSINNEINETLNKLPQQIILAIAGGLDEQSVKDATKVIQTVRKICELANVYEQYVNIYKNLRVNNYSAIAKLVQAEIPQDAFNKIKDQLKARLLEEIDQILTSPNLPNTSDIITFVTDLKTLLEQAQQFENVFEHAQEAIKQIKPERILTQYFKQTIQNLTVYNNAINDLKALKDDYEKKKKEFEALGKNFITEIKQRLDDKRRELEKEIRGSAEYSKVLSTINELERLMRKISEISHQRLEYTFVNEKFHNASLGVISFMPNTRTGKTRLSVNVVYNLEFDISGLDKPPTIKKQSFITNSKLTNFKIGFLQLIFIDFDNVTFVTGSDVKDDFKVKIKNVEFGGPLNFVQAFKEYLQSMDRNLVFDIDESGARIGYGFPLPDITAGYFNFFNFSITALLTLPFDPKKSLQLNLGLGSDLNKFGITVCGIFGGQGYFNIIVEPKRGVVGMILVLEFGAIFNLNLGLAYGTAYLVGGIYIKRYSGNVELRGYILCVGRFNVLGLFSANMSFYMGLEGNSHVLVGRCTVRVSKRFTRWFEVSVECTFEKTIKGAKSENNNPERELKHIYLEKGVNLLHVNDDTVSHIAIPEWHYKYVYDKLEFELLPEWGEVKNVILKPEGGGTLSILTAKIHAGKVVFDIPSGGIQSQNDGRSQSKVYKLFLQAEKESYYSIVNISSPNLKKPEAEKDRIMDRIIDAHEYYGAYYQS